MTQRNRGRRQRRRGSARGKLAGATIGALALIGIAFFAITSWVFGVADKAPSLASCRQLGRTPNTTLYAADGSRLGIVSSPEVRLPVRSSRIPATLEHATVAIEDQRFYQHGGIDLQGIARAALNDLEAGRAAQGGSTLTQQLVRNLCLPNPARTIERKIVEAKLALEYSKHHSKQQVLSQYLNSVPYGTVAGSTAIGVGAAARIFFDKPVWKLSLEQQALLAGLPQAPTAYNPLLHPAAARKRRDEVLAKMAALGYVPAARARAAARRGLELDPSRGFFAHRQPYFFDFVERRLIARYGVRRVRRGGLKVYTTVSPTLQRVALAAMRSALPYSTDPAAALVAIDPRDGEIRAMVNSTSYAHSQFNLAAQGHRQPGSTFKSFVLTTAIRQGIDPYSTYYVSKPLDLDLAHWGHWEVHTADEGYQGRINLQQATVTSDNTVFAQLDLDVGPAAVAATAHAMGIRSPLQGIPAEGIGGLRVGVSPLELSDAYATLADGGVHRQPVAIDKVVFPSGRVEHPEGPQPRRAISRAVAYQVTRLLHDNITEGTGTAAYTGCLGQAGKTGTTDSYTDAWFAGYQPNLATAVWVGYPQSNAISMTDVNGITVFGGTYPAQIWNALYAQGGVPCVEFKPPAAKVDWAPFYGRFTATAPHSPRRRRGRQGGEPPPGSAAVGGYNPYAYAPGVGQKPAPLPTAPQGDGVGGGEAVGGGE